MSKSKIREDFRKLAKWSILKMYDKNPDGTITLRELQKELDAAWQELLDDGEITNTWEDNE